MVGEHADKDVGVDAVLELMKINMGATALFISSSLQMISRRSGMSFLEGAGLDVSHSDAFESAVFIALAEGYGSNEEAYLSPRLRG